MSKVLAELGHPIVAAPMAGGPSTPALAAAVSEAGGLGFLGAGYLSPDRLAEDLAETWKLTGAKIGVNVFVPDYAPVDLGPVRAYARRLSGEATWQNTTLGDPVGGDDSYTAKLALLRERPVAVVSFAFGLPGADTVRKLQACGSEVWVTLTRPEDAAEATTLGVDAIIAQGIEAGGHRGGTVDTDDYALLPLLRLLAARTDLPLVAAGGVADGAGLAAALAAGASAAQIGTAFLACPEAGTPAVHRAALAGRAPIRLTRVTRAFTGRKARGIENGFMAKYDEYAPAAYPHLHQMTAPLRAAARATGDADSVNSWAGQAYPLIRELPAADLVRLFSTEAAAALDGARRRFG
jgi:nitronate monooxygenase